METKTLKPYRIGIDARFFRSETGGIGRYSRELISHLAEIDQFNEYTVFLTQADLPEWELNQANFKVKVVEAIHYSVAEQTKFLRVLWAEHLDLVHFLNFNHPVLYNRPFITTLHDLTMFFYPAGKSQKSLVRRMAFKQVMRHSLAGAKKVIAISEFSASDAAKHFNVSQAKMERIYEGGPDVKELPFGNKSMVQQYMGSLEPYFLFVSQWRPHKGIITLIEAFDKFKAKTGAPHKLVLIGRQKVSQVEVKEAMARSPYFQDIITPGFAPEELLPSLYHNATAFVMPSEYEGFGLPILEAYAYQAPVIAANNSSLPEVVGKGGLLFPTKDSGALADCMTEIYNKPELALKLIAEGQKHLSKFSWGKMAEETLALYQRVLEKKR